MRRAQAGFPKAWVALTALVAATISGCAGSGFIYVRYDDGDTYFKVPATWRQVDQKALDALIFGDPAEAKVQLAKQLAWTIAYDADSTPAAQHLLGGSAEHAFVLAKVQALTREQRDQASLDSLRNAMGLPVAVPADVRKQLEETATYPYRGFELLADEVLPAENGARGVRVIFNLRVGGGPLQTFDLTSYLSGDGTTVSSLLLRCSAECYRKRSQEFEAIAQSFTVKRLTG